VGVSQFEASQGKKFETPSQQKMMCVRGMPVIAITVGSIHRKIEVQAGLGKK
jgi:hypothetical protein